MKKISIVALIAFILIRITREFKGEFPIILKYLCISIVLSYPYIIAWYKKKTSIKIAKIIAISWTAFLIYGTSLIILNERKNKSQRVYNGVYKGKINEKYPKEFAKAEYYRKIILKSIKSSKKTRDKNNFYIEYFDEKGRLVYEIKQQSKVFDYVRKYHGTKGESTYRGKAIVNPEEVGYIYGANNNIEIKIYIKSYGTSDISDLDENTWNSFLKNGWSAWEPQIFEYRDISKNEKIATIEIIYPSSQYFNRVERRYINNTLVSEKELVDREDRYSFMMLNTEKRYNKDGKLIYKTVERIDKTNGYKSFTEMDFEKHKVVTKYYKDQKVIATVTEDFLGEEKTRLCSI